MIAPALLATLGLGALAASLALLAARLGLWMAADVLAVTAAVLGLGSFLAVGLSTLRRARRLPRGSRS